MFASSASLEPQLHNIEWVFEKTVFVPQSLYKMPCYAMRVLLYALYTFQCCLRVDYVLQRMARMWLKLTQSQCACKAKSGYSSERCYMGIKDTQASVCVWWSDALCNHNYIYREANHSVPHLNQLRHCRRYIYHTQLATKVPAASLIINGAVYGSIYPMRTRCWLESTARILGRMECLLYSSWFRSH